MECKLTEILNISPFQLKIIIEIISPRVRGCYLFRPPLISEIVENLIWVLNLFCFTMFYMTKDIAYFPYIFGDNGANML